MKIIYLAGLGHSGSTMLDLSLGCLKDVVGLGEIKNTLDKKEREKHFESTCSCGVMGNQCNLWCEIDKELDEKSDQIAKYETITKVLQKHYGKNTVLIDSSKNSYSYLQKLSKNHDVRIIFLTRDVRSWSYSRYLHTNKPILYFIFRWFAENKKLQYRLRKMNLSFFNVGYEELSLYPDLVLKKITEYTGVTYNKDVLQPAKSKSHIISGNIARVDKFKRKNWSYDARWLLSSRLQVLSPIILLFTRYNSKLVYRNLKGSGIHDFYLFGKKRRTEMSEKNN
ncbi:MAG TPA: sulfotransferase [Bacteroidales bacterium]|nr:sulfotransferase [Bacteroidales bacterium]